MYQSHPSNILKELFQSKPYQGASPDQAKYLFVGLDANYAPNVEHSSSFQDILDYHTDGVSFWLKHGLHHPFLLPNYKGDGRRYHVIFSNLGFSPKNAAEVSFIELLHTPTVGRSKLEISDFNYDHLQLISSLITRGDSRYVFLSRKVITLMRATGYFKWLPNARSKQILPKLTTIGETEIYQHLHLSNYGIYQSRMNEEAIAIKRLISSV